MRGFVSGLVGFASKLVLLAMAATLTIGFGGLAVAVSFLAGAWVAAETGLGLWTGVPAGGALFLFLSLGVADRIQPHLSAAVKALGEGIGSA